MEREKQSKGEKAIEKAIASFMNFQSEAEERFLKSEEERQKREFDIEERRRDEREHEVRLFQMLGQILGQRQRPQDDYSTFTPSHTPLPNYDYDAY